jgi:hypothetical protein
MTFVQAIQPFCQVGKSVLSRYPFKAPVFHFLALVREETPDFFRLTRIRKNSENKTHGGDGKNRLGRF